MVIITTIDLKMLFFLNYHNLIISLKLTIWFWIYLYPILLPLFTHHMSIYYFMWEFCRNSLCISPNVKGVWGMTYDATITLRKSSIHFSITNFKFLRIIGSYRFLPIWLSGSYSWNHMVVMPKMSFTREQRIERAHITCLWARWMLSSLHSEK